MPGRPSRVLGHWLLQTLLGQTKGRVLNYWPEPHFSNEYADSPCLLHPDKRCPPALCHYLPSYLHKFSNTHGPCIHEVTMRPPRDEYFLEMAHLVSTRSTCVRRAVGAIAVDAHNHVLATGYNGVPSGFPHCNEGHPCSGANARSGMSLDSCLAVHAEINMLAQCNGVTGIHTVYCTASPCISCLKALLTTSTRRLVFSELYPAPGAQELWTRLPGREWIHHV